MINSNSSDENKNFEKLVSVTAKCLTSSQYSKDFSGEIVSDSNKGDFKIL